MRRRRPTAAPAPAADSGAAGEGPAGPSSAQLAGSEEWPAPTGRTAPLLHSGGQSEEQASHTARAAALSAKAGAFR